MSTQKQKNTKESKRKKGEEEQHWTKPAPGRKNIK